LLYFAFSLSFFQREGCPWDRVSLYWQSLKDEKGNLSYTPSETEELPRSKKNNFARWLYFVLPGSGSPA